MGSTDCNLYIESGATMVDDGGTLVPTLAPGRNAFPEDKTRVLIRVNLFAQF